MLKKMALANSKDGCKGDDFVKAQEEIRPWKRSDIDHDSLWPWRNSRESKYELPEAAANAADAARRRLFLLEA